MMKLSSARLSLVGLAAIFLLLVASGCKETLIQTPTPTPTIGVSLLVQTDDTDARWFRDVRVPKGTDAYELTERVTQGNIKAKYYPAFRSHFVDAIFGVESANPRFWLIFLWNESEKKWEPLPVGADLYSLKDGHILAWYYTDTSKPDAVPPTKP